MKPGSIKIAGLIIFYFFIVSFNKTGTHHSPLSEREIDIKINYKVTIKGHVNRMKIKMIIPGNIKDRQTINKMSFSIEPDSIYKRDENTFAFFTFHDIEKSFKIVLHSNITIYRVINAKSDSMKPDLSKYLITEQDIETDSPRIIELAASLKQKTDIETVMKTFEYVDKNIMYELNPAIGAEKVLLTHVGKCMDFSDLFVALLRANKIPAKSVFGMVVDDYDDGNPLHAWPEVYLKKQGWVRFDPTTGHSEITQIGKDYVMQISNKYVTLSEGRNDPELHLAQCYYWYDSTAGSEVKVKISYDIVA